MRKQSKAFRACGAFNSWLTNRTRKSTEAIKAMIVGALMFAFIWWDSGDVCAENLTCHRRIVMREATVLTMMIVIVAAAPSIGHLRDYLTGKAMQWLGHAQPPAS